jgi:hypothetical protein
MSQATNFIKQILLFLAYSVSSVVKITNKTFFHMLWMVRFEVEISASVSGFSVAFDGFCCLFPDDKKIQKRNFTAWLYFHSEVDGRPWTIERAEKIL